MDDFGKIYDATFLEEAFNALHARVSWLLAMAGVDDVVVQKVLLVMVMGTLLWIFARRLSTIGYRVNVPVGVVVQTVTLGPLLTFLLVAVPAWIALRHAAIEKALLSLLTP